MLIALYRSLCVGSLLVAALPSPVLAIEQGTRYTFDIKPKSLKDMIFEVAERANVQVFFLPQAIQRAQKGTAVRGRLTAAEALQTIIANSGLTVVVDQRGTYIIKAQDGPQEDRGFFASDGVQPQVAGVSEREPDMGAEKTQFDEIVTIGSRRRGRTVTESMVPIDVFQLDGFNSTGYADMNDAFRTLVPAFNAKRLPLNDGSSLVRPVTLRSSPSDHILLLLNGKRRHRSATVHIATGHASTSGAQGQDFNVIPPIAMKRVEILRDGAAALYGSDAIAGVVNMTLRDSRDHSVASAHIGKYYDGGGATKDLQVNLGLPLGARGFASLSAQYTHQNPTRTGGVHQGAQALRNAGVPDVPTPAVNMGEPFYEAFKTVLNAGLPLGNDLDAYLFGNYMVSNSAVRFFYRQPIDAGGFARHATYRPSVFQGTDGHPENFDLQTVYPGGYTPRFGGHQQDASMVGGVRRESTDGLSWDAYLRWGWNEIQYNIENTINASMGVQSPTSFNPGALAQREYEGGVELSYPLEIGLPIQRGIFSAGLSYRSEAYTIRPGDEASYRVGPLVDLPAGANGFQGYSPDIAGTFTAASYASFLSYDADISDRLSAAATGRFEHYEKFGDNFSYQLSSRYKLAEGLAVRGSLGTGFRAPASGQLYGTSQTSQSSVAGDFILDAVLVLDAETAKIFGAEPFKPETSFSMSAGVVAKLQTGTTLTLDFYQIDVDDRLTLIPEFDTTPEQRQQLAAIGYPNGEAVQQVRYYQNILDSRIKGFDLVVLHGWNWAGGDNTTASLSLNYNDMSLRTPRAEEVFTPEKRIEFEDGIPRWNGNLSVTHVQNRVTFMVRGTYYGSWKRRSVVEGKPFLSRSPAVLFDAQAAYRLDDGLELQIGARNIFNKKAPQREPEIIATGNNVDNHSVFGVSGGYYYAGLRYDF